MVRYKYYLQYGPKFRWRTDNSAIKYIKTMECPSGILDRWLTTLSDFNFQVEHRAGVKHTNADGLSRSGHPEKPEDDEGGINAMPTFKQRHLFTHTRDEVRNLQEEDEEIGPIKAWVRNKINPSKMDTSALSRIGKVYAGLMDSLMIDSDDLLKYKMPNSNTLMPKKVTCLPKILWDDTIRIAHVAGGHMSRDYTSYRLRTSVYFPGMRDEVDGYIKACLTCQAKGRKGPDQRHTLVSPLQGYPFQRLHIDYVGPLNEGKRTRAKWILSCRDGFSKWVEGIPLERATAEATVRALEKETRKYP
jgi:hypothetical protein